MSKKTRRSFSPEFKLETAQLVVDQGYSHHEAANAMGVGFSTIGKWVKQLQHEREGVKVKQTPMTPEQLEIRELKKRNARLELEKEILKKATEDLSEQLALVEKLSQSDEGRYPVNVLCELFGVHRSTYKY